MLEDEEEAEKRKEAEALERKKQSHDLVAESIRRELLESMCPSVSLTLLLT
jgi:microfibrillar-associated protein 1